MNVFAAMLIDSYRELNSKRMFWIILALSALFVIVYGSIGFNDNGISMLFGLWQIERDFIKAGSPLSGTLYRAIFSSFVVGLWLAWIATILALVSTASIFPDFIAGGSIDLVLCRPIKRITIFLMKYISSMLFVGVQVAIVCVGAFVCMGLRLGDWEWRLFLAIPIVLLFFSYLFSICVFFGVWTRSTLAALLFTMMAWFGLYALNQTEAIIGTVQGQMRVQMENGGRHFERDSDGVRVQAPVDMELQDTIDTLDTWRRRVKLVKAPFPKTDLTIAILDRLLLRDTDLNLVDIFAGNFQMNADGQFVPKRDEEDQAMSEMMAEYTDHSTAYIIGTSVAFEVVLLGLACFIFVWRDY